jgi:hypothetical protein
MVLLVTTPQPRRVARLAAWVAVLIALLPGQLSWLWLLRGPLILAREPVLIWGQCTLGVTTLAMLWLLRTTPADAIRLARRTSVLLILGGTALLQAAAIALLAPALSDDLFRYRLDGRMWLHGVSPYATSPEEFLSAHGGDALDVRVPFKDVRTIYPPVSQGIFTLARAAESGSSPVAPSPAWRPRTPDAWRSEIVTPPLRERTTVVRTTFALFAVAAVAVLVLTLARAGQSVWWAGLLGFNPLLTLEVGGMGHQDAVGLLLLVTTAACVAARRFGPAAVALALACGVKPYAGLLLPFLYRQAHEEDSFRAGRRTLAVFALTLIAACLPPLLYQHGLSPWRKTVAQFGQSWEGNAYLYESFKQSFGAGDEGRQMVRAKDAARLLSALAVLGTGLLLWQTRARFPAAAYWLFLVLLLTAPVAYPWYLLWLLGVVPLLRGPHGAAALVWSATAAMAYTVWRGAATHWSVPQPWLVGQYLPVLAAVATEVVSLARRGHSSSQSPSGIPL